MALLDVSLALLVGVMAFMGLRSGLIHESITLLGLVVGMLVAGRYNEQLGVFLVPWLHTRGMANLAAFLLILAGTWLLLLFVGAFLREVLVGLHLGWLDNAGGMLMGIAKGLVIAEIIVLVLMATPVPGVKEAISKSSIAGPLAGLAPDLLDLVPPVLRYWKPIP